MKKLLLILICLFVSFEVKSESDDLSGKKLLCKNNVLNLWEGYKFVSEEEVINYSYWLGGKVIVTRGKYTTSLTQIKLTFHKKDLVPPKIIDRQELKSGFLHQTLTSQCRIFDGNFESYYKNLHEKDERELKSKQKI